MPSEEKTFYVYLNGCNAPLFTTKEGLKTLRTQFKVVAVKKSKPLAYVIEGRKGAQPQAALVQPEAPQAPPPAAPGGFLGAVGTGVGLGAGFVVGEEVAGVFFGGRNMKNKLKQ